jgi:hypothetical protein
VIVPPPHEPMRTGGAGTVLEVVVLLTVLGASALSSLAVSLAPMPAPERTRKKRSGDEKRER